jgi:hypothetical protein
MMRLLVFLTLLPVAALGATPETETQIRRIELALSHASQEQQSLHQQFQMVQEISRMEAQKHTASGPHAGVAAPPANYDDVVRARQEASEKLKQYIDEMNWLYVRFREIDTEKQRLREQLMQLLEAR